MKKNIIRFFYCLILLLTFNFHLNSKKNPYKKALNNVDSRLQVSDEELANIIQRTAGRGSSGYRLMDSSSILTNLNALDFINIIKTPFYIKTNPINKDSLENNVSIINKKVLSKNGFDLNLSFFWNQTNAAFFTSDSNTINSYLKITDDGIIEKIKSIAEIASGSINIPSIASTLGQFKVQERRIGTMFKSSIIYPNWILEISLPMYYLERNFYLTPEEIEKLRSLGYVE